MGCVYRRSAPVEENQRTADISSPVVTSSEVSREAESTASAPGATVAPSTATVGGGGLARVAPGAEAVLSATRETSLEVTTGDELSAVRWFSSTGALRRYTQPTAWFSADDANADDDAGPGASPGHLAVVLRTAAGGVSWRVLVTKLAR